MIVTGIYRYILPDGNRYIKCKPERKPYVELLIWENSEEHMVIVKYDSTGSYFILNNKRYNVKNIGTYFNPVFIVEDD